MHYKMNDQKFIPFFSLPNLIFWKHQELKDETGRLYKLLSERDHEVRKLKKKRDEERQAFSGQRNDWVPELSNTVYTTTYMLIGLCRDLVLLSQYFAMATNLPLFVWLSLPTAKTNPRRSVIDVQNIQKLTFDCRLNVKKTMVNQLPVGKLQQPDQFFPMSGRNPSNH